MQQFACVQHAHGVGGAIKNGGDAERGVPTAADSRQINVASFPDSLGRSLQSRLTRSTQVSKSAPQLFGLTENVVEKVSHRACSAGRCRLRFRRQPPCKLRLADCQAHGLPVTTHAARCSPAESIKGWHTISKRELFQRDNSALQRGGRGLSTVSHVEFFEHVADMQFHRHFGDV